MKQKITYIVISVFCVTLGVCGTAAMYHYFPPTSSEAVEKSVKEVTVTEADSLKSAVEKVYDAVVVVKTYKNNRLVSTGTGFVYKTDDTYGYLLTNHHVVEDGNNYKIFNSAEQEIEAVLLGSDEYADLAVLRIDKAYTLKNAVIGDSTISSLGDTLFTVGTPVDEAYFGTVTKGILSGKNRTVSVSLNNTEYMMEVLQTDAAINPGNSGGPLCNINGEVIGINSLKLVEDEVEGMGFAIPIEYAMAAVDRLEKGEEIERPVIGVELSDITYADQLARWQGITIDGDLDYGAVIVSVTNGMPANTAGLQKGDVITYVDDVKISSTGHFRFILYKYEIGDTITVKYNRAGKEATTKIILNKTS